MKLVKKTILVLPMALVMLSACGGTSAPSINDNSSLSGPSIGESIGNSSSSPIHTHTLVHHDRIEPACETAGQIEYWACNACGKYFSNANGTLEITNKDAVSLEALGHEYGDWVIDIAPTETTEGERSKHCERCDERTSVEKIPVLVYSNGLTYELNSDNTYSVTGIGSCTDTNLNIRPTYEGQPVTTIAEQAFRSNGELKSVVLPEGIITIKDFAFAQCSGLLKIVLPNSLLTIGSSAFYCCYNLNTITMGSGVRTIEGFAFNLCNAIYKVFYVGTSDEWNEIDIKESSNFELTSATRYYYSETAPTASGNYWHYVEGYPTIWEIL